MTEQSQRALQSVLMSVDIGLLGLVVCGAQQHEVVGGERAGLVGRDIGGRGMCGVPLLQVERVGGSGSISVRCGREHGK